MENVVLPLLVLVPLILAILLINARRSESSDSAVVTLTQFSALVDRISTTGKNGAFWVVLIPETDRADGFAANFQISLENDHLGMDWVLLAQRNVEDRSKFEAFARSQGLEAKELVQNDVHYLRVEGADRLADQSNSFLQSVYGVTDATKMKLIVADFTWP